MSKSENKIIGMIGEKAVIQYLENIGVDIIETNYSVSMGEIDVIFIDGETLVFGEVKTRRSSYYGKPSDSVNIDKRKRIINVAKNYINICGKKNINIRFDVFEVYYYTKKIVHFKNAFWEGQFW